MENPAEKIYDLIRYVASATRSSTSTSATSRAGSTIFVDVFSSHPRLAREYVVPVRMCSGRSTSRWLTDHGDAKRSSIVFIAAIAVVPRAVSLAYRLSPRRSALFPCRARTPIANSRFIV